MLPRSTPFCIFPFFSKCSSGGLRDLICDNNDILDRYIFIQCFNFYLEHLVRQLSESEFHLEWEKVIKAGTD